MYLNMNLVFKCYLAAVKPVLLTVYLMMPIKMKNGCTWLSCFMIRCIWELYL